MKPFASLLSLGLLCAGALAAQTPSVTGSSEASLASGTAINAELNSSVDSKKAKAGEQIVAHVTEAVKSADGRTILPNGTKIIGHVTQASARTNGQGQAMLAFQFDKAMLKGGQEMPLSNAAVLAVAAPAREASTFASEPGPSPSAGGGATTTPNNPSMSGSRGARPEGTPTAQPYPGAGGNGAPGVEANSNGPLSANTRGVFGLDGVRLNAGENGQGTVLTSSGKNVHLDGGTRLLLTVQAPGTASNPSGS